MPKRVTLHTPRPVKLLSVAVVVAGTLVLLPTNFAKASLLPSGFLTKNLSLTMLDAKDVLTTISNWLPFGNDKNKKSDNTSKSSNPKAPEPVNQNAARLPSAIQTEPSLYRIMQAEFSADRGDIATALAIYKQQAFYDNATAVFERGLGLSIANEPVSLSLNFAQSWQKRHPEHIPALFYVTHLALKAHDYQTAGAKLDQILVYDPDADLSQILTGIYPTQSQDQAELLATLQKINTRENPSLLVMRAGLLLQFNQPEQALNDINKALRKNPQSPAFMVLKADILQKLGSPDEVIKYITQARQQLPDNKSLFLYQARYLLNQGRSGEAWQLLHTNPEFLADDEIKLLTALVGVDSQRYTDADRLLKDLTSNPTYKDQAYYYLAISSERQLKTPQAIEYYGKVMQTDLVLAARKKQVALLLEAKRYDDAIASMVRLRDNFDDFIPQSYIMQASILQKINQPAQALALLNDAQKKLPDNTDIMFAKVLLLPDDDFANRRTLLEQIMQLAPDNSDYRLEYAQTLVNQKADAPTVTRLLMPLIRDASHGLKARQILAQQALHQKNYPQIISLLSDNFDIEPDIISGLLLRQAYIDLHDISNLNQVKEILTHQLHYNESEAQLVTTSDNGTSTAVLTHP